MGGSMGGSFTSASPTVSGRDGPAFDLGALPPELLAHVMGFLQPRDTARCAACCTAARAAARLPEAWHGVAHAFGCRLRATGEGSPDWPAVWRAVVAAPSSGALRFRGIFTDGGCDEGEMQFWVDNMFAPNHWESYCSERPRNVTAIGLLLGGKVPIDVAEAEHRRFIIDRCRVSVQVMYGNAPHPQAQQAGAPPVRLESWSTVELEHFLHLAFDLLQQGHPMGRLLCVGLQPQDVEPTLNRIANVCASLHTRHELRKREIVGAPGEATTMLDTAAVPLLAAPDPHSHHQIAVVERLFVSRAGHFSCPMRSGVVFLGCWRAALDADVRGGVHLPAPDLMTHLQAVATEEVCAAFDGVGSREALSALGRRSAGADLPGAVCVGASAAGEWVEFDPHWTPPGNARGILRPVVWVRFFSVEEAAAAAELIPPPACRRIIYARPQPLDRLLWPTDAIIAERAAATAAAAVAAASAACAAANTAAGGQPLAGHCGHSLAVCPGGVLVGHHPGGCCGCSSFAAASTKRAAAPEGAAPAAPEGAAPAQVAAAAAASGAAAPCNATPGAATGGTMGVPVGGGGSGEAVGGRVSEDASMATAAVEGSGGSTSSVTGGLPVVPGVAALLGAATPSSAAVAGPSSVLGPLSDGGGGGDSSRSGGSSAPSEGFHLDDWQSAGLLSEGDESGSDHDEPMDDAPPDAAPPAAGGEAGAGGMPAGPGQRDYRRSTEGRNRLDVRLVRRHAGSMAAVKLVEGENLMAAWGDRHEETNIDVAAVAFRGRCVQLPPSVRLA